MFTQMSVNLFMWRGGGGGWSWDRIVGRQVERILLECILVLSKFCLLMVLKASVDTGYCSTLQVQPKEYIVHQTAILNLKEIDLI